MGKSRLIQTLHRVYVRRTLLSRHFYLSQCKSPVHKEHLNKTSHINKKKQPKKAQMWCCALVHQASVHLIHVHEKCKKWDYEHGFCMFCSWVDQTLRSDSALVSIFLHRYPADRVSMAPSCVAHPAPASSSAGFGPRYSWGCGTCRAWHWDWRCHPCWTTRAQPAPRCSDTPAPVSVSPDWRKRLWENKHS